ncbi:MAG: PQ-loop repeat-containing protein [Alphaproteobacteria bacterium]|nr:PQ-loop repeat-containing protein [Alphaproteobacteria bacterium]
MIQVLVEVCGWIGALSYAVYSIPQAIDCIRKGYTEGLSSVMVLLLFFGGLFSLLSILPDVTSPLFYNYLPSVLASSTILRYHFFPRK